MATKKQKPRKFKVLRTFLTDKKEYKKGDEVVFSCEFTINHLVNNKLIKEA